MSHFKKALASLALATLTLFIGAPIANASLGFTDDGEIPSWAEEAITELMDQGVISGNDDGSFAPNRQLNRAEVAKIIVLGTGIDLDESGTSFDDVEEGTWFYPYVMTMRNQGWIDGYPDGMFRPEVGINRAEIAKMVVNAFELDQDLTGAPHFDDVSEADWFYPYVETAYNYGLMRGYGDGTFGPANAVTRAETVKIVYDAQLAVSAPVGPAEGTLEVMLSTDTPRGTNVPYNATSVPYTTIELTASDDADIEISSLTLTRLGLGDNDDFDSVWLEIDGFKVGNDKSINNDDIAELRFNPPIVVPAGQTLVADVVASAKYSCTGDCNTGGNDDKNVGHNNRIALVAADDIASTAANVVGDFPIEGEEMQIADYEVTQLQFSGLGSDTTIDVGDNFIEIGKFRLLNSSNTNKDVELRAITFKNDGTANIESTLENVALYVSGEQVSAETIIDGDYITFRLDNGVTGGYVIEDGDSRIFSMRADIVSAEKGDNLNWKIDNFEDLVAVEIGTSFGVKTVAGYTGYSLGTASTAAPTTACTTANGAEDDCARMRLYTIDSGDLNVSRDPSSLGNQQYSPGSNDVVVMTARLVVDQPLLVDGVKIYVSSAAVTDVSDKDNADGDNNAATGNGQKADYNLTFDNYRLFLNDKLVDSENQLTAAADTTLCSATTTSCYLNFDTTFEVAGTSILKLVVNIKDVAATDDQIRMNLNATDFQSPEYISTGDQVKTEGLLGSATGSYVQVKSSQLQITESSGIADGTKIVAGVDDVTFMKFILDNNDSGDVNVSSVSVAADTTVNLTGAGVGVSGKARTYTNFTAAIFVDGIQQGSAKNLSSTGAATFNDLSVVIPSAGQKEFTLVVDTIEASATLFTTLTAGGTSEAGATFDVTSTAGMAVGDILMIGGNSEAITVIVDANTVTTDGATFADVADGTTVTVKSQLKLNVTAVDADNIENGKTLDVYNGGALITATPLAGKMFELIQSGRLTASLGSTISPAVIVAGAKDVEVLRISFDAADDEVQIKDIYLENDVTGPNDETVDNVGTGDRLDFKLYNAAGQLVQTKQMTGGSLHFQLANQDRIRVPKDGTTYVTIKVDARAITQASQTAARLLLSLDNNLNATKGIVALTASTGGDITTPAATPFWESAVGKVASDNFVVYKSNISVKPATTQPSFSDPQTGSQEVYRFTVTADTARQIELGRVTLDLSLQGMQKAAAADILAADLDVKQIRTDGQRDDTTVVTSSIATNANGNGTYNEAADADSVSARVVINFSNQKLAAGESKTYALMLANTENDAGALANDDSVSVTIKTDSTYVAGSALNTLKIANPTYNVIWSDMSDTSHSDTTLDWIGGYLTNINTGATVNSDPN